MKKIPRRDLILLAILGALVLTFYIPKVGFGPIAINFDLAKKSKGVYYCPMHPTYTSDRPGDCPICNMKLVQRTEAKGKKHRKILYYRHPMGQPDISPVPKKDSMGMDYIPVYEGEASGVASKVPGHATVNVPLEKQQTMGVKIGPVEKRKLVKEIRTVGRVAFDPELYAAQQEFVSAVDSARKAKGGPYHEPLERTQALVEATKIRLRLLGMSEPEIESLEEEALRDQNLILPRGISKDHSSLMQNYVWVYGNIYEYELPFVKIGTEVKITVPTFYDREFEGEIRAIDPVLNSQTRSVRIRVRVPNSEGLLKPEMYLDLYIRSDLGEGVAVPQEAVMFTGERTIIFVAHPGGFFEPREVKLGTQVEHFYEVKSGLQAGEQIATSGNFLIDSESRLQGALTGMGSGHQHG